MSKWSLSSDKITDKKVTATFIYLIVTTILVWIIVNDPTNYRYGLIYFIMSTTWFVATLFDFTFKKNELIDTVSEEDRKKRPINFLRNLKDWQYVSIAMILGFITLFTVTNQQSLLISAPKFQIAPFIESTWYNALLTGLVAIPESLFFAGFLFPTIFSSINRQTKTELITLPIAILATSLIFCLFHFMVYGTANLIGTEAVFMFGIRMCLWTYLFRGLLPTMTEHFANNLMASFLSVYTVAALV